MARKTGEKPREIVDIVIGVLVDRSAAVPRILVAQRRREAVLGGLWEFPGGKIETGETHAAALKREFEEELGVSIDVGEALNAIEHTYPHGHVCLHPYYCTLKAGQPQNRHVAAHRWVTPAELRTLSFPPANANLINHLIQQFA